MIILLDFVMSQALASSHGEEMNVRLLTIDELSNRLGFSKGHIYNMVSRGEIPFVKLSRKALRFAEDAIERWIIERNFQTRQNEKPVAACPPYSGPDRRSGADRSDQ